MRRVRQAGFTLIEIVAVLLLAGVLTAIIMKRNATIEASNNVTAETAILKTNLRYAQIKSMNSTYTDIWRISFIPGGYTLQQYDDAASTWLDRNMPNETVDPDSDGLHESHFFSGGVVKSAGAAAILFDNWGIPVQTDRVTPLTSDTTITLSADGNSSSLTITHNTGYIP